MSDQTTDHLSEAVEAIVTHRRSIHGEALDADHTRAVAREDLAVAEPILATYYEDKGAEKLKRVEEERDWRLRDFESAEDDAIKFEKRAEKAEAELAAAEDKGRLEERERLRARLQAEADTRRDRASMVQRPEAAQVWLDYALVVENAAADALDTDQEAGNG